MGRRGRAPREGAEGAPREGAEGGRRQRRRHLQLGERREQVALQIDLLVDTHVDAAPRVVACSLSDAQLGAQPLVLVTSDIELRLHQSPTDCALRRASSSLSLSSSCSTFIAAIVAQPSLQTLGGLAQHPPTCINQCPPRRKKRTPWPQAKECIFLIIWRRSNAGVPGASRAACRGSGGRQRSEGASGDGRVDAREVQVSGMMARRWDAAKDR